MKRKIIFLIALLLMIVSSLFTGADIKGWVFLYQFELELIEPFVPNGQYVFALVTILIFISHFTILILPLLIKKKFFNSLLIGAPIVFVKFFNSIWLDFFSFTAIHSFLGNCFVGTQE